MGTRKQSLETTNISLSTGYFVSKNTMIGVSANTSNTYTKTVQVTNSSTNSSSDQSTDFSFGLYSKIYKPLHESFAFFIQTNMMIGASHSGIREEGMYLQSFLLRPGITYFLTPHWGFSLTYGTFGYQRELRTYEIDKKDFGLDFDKSTAMFSVQYYLFKNRE